MARKLRVEQLSAITDPGKALLEQMEGKMGRHHAGAERQETAEPRASRLLAEELRRRGWDEAELKRRKKSDHAQAEIAQRLRRETTVTWDWMARVHASVFGRSFWQMREVSSGNGGSQNELTATFGLGDAATADKVLVEWPSGARQELLNVATKRVLSVQEPALSLTTPRVGNGELRALIIAEANSTQELQASTDLVNWVSIATLTNATGPLPYSAPLTSPAHRFFRVVTRLRARTM